MLGHEAIGAAQQREGILLLGAGGEDDALGRRNALGRHRHGYGSIAACPPQELNGAHGLFVDLIHLDQPHDGVVEAREDGAIVTQKGIGDAGQLCARLFIGDTDGLVVYVARGHHKQRHQASRFVARFVHRRIRRIPRFSEIVHEQMLHRCVRQHDPQFGQSIGQACANSRARAFTQQHNGSRRPRQNRLFLFARLAKRPHIAHSLGHHRHGLPIAPLAPAQLGHRIGIVGVTYQMEAPEPLHSQDFPRHEHFHRRRENGIGLLAGFP